MLEFLRRFGSIQYDPIAVAGRSHDLVLHARIAGYEASWSDSLYERRELFEAINKGLSFILTSDYPWFRRSWSRSAQKVLAENAEVAERVLARVRADGPLAVGDFERERGATTDWFGAPANVVRVVLEAYTVTGELGLARRDENRRYYDVVERLLPRDVLERELPLTRAASAHDAVPIPRARPPGRQQRRGRLRRARPRQAGPEVFRSFRGGPRCARS